MAAVVGIVSIGLLVGLREAPSKTARVHIDASRPNAIEPPFEIVEIGEHGELGLWLGAQAGDGWKGEGGGAATYQFYAPADGAYTIWAYCLWHDACANAIYARIDDSPRAILGNDPVYGRWHWVRGFEISLKRGFHQLRLSNHSSNVALQKIFLTNDPADAPPDADASAATVLFRDDFNGCDRGNFPLWRQAAGEWAVEHPDERANSADNVLVGRSEQSALIVYDRQRWTTCRLTASMSADLQAGRDVAVGIRFGVGYEGAYDEICLSAAPDGEGVVVGHRRNADGTVRTLASGRLPWRAGSWHELRLDLTGDRPTLLLDGGARFVGGEGKRSPGGLAFAIYGPLKAQFDNVLVRTSPGE